MTASYFEYKVTYNEDQFYALISNALDGLDEFILTPVRNFEFWHEKDHNAFNDPDGFNNIFAGHPLIVTLALIGSGISIAAYLIGAASRANRKQKQSNGYLSLEYFKQVYLKNLNRDKEEKDVNNNIEQSDIDYDEEQKAFNITIQCEKKDLTTAELEKIISEGTRKKIREKVCAQAEMNLKALIDRRYAGEFENVFIDRNDGKLILIPKNKVLATGKEPTRLTKAVDFLTNNRVSKFLSPVWLALCVQFPMCYWVMFMLGIFFNAYSGMALIGLVGSGAAITTTLLGLSLFTFGIPLIPPLVYLVWKVGQYAYAKYKERQFEKEQSIELDPIQKQRNTDRKKLEELSEAQLAVLDFQRRQILKTALFEEQMDATRQKLRELNAEALVKIAYDPTRKEVGNNNNDPTNSAKFEESPKKEQTTKEPDFIARLKHSKVGRRVFFMAVLGFMIGSFSVWPIQDFIALVFEIGVAGTPLGIGIFVTFGITLLIISCYAIYEYVQAKKDFQNDQENVKKFENDFANYLENENELQERKRTISKLQAQLDKQLNKYNNLRDEVDKNHINLAIPELDPKKWNPRVAMPEYNDDLLGIRERNGSFKEQLATFIKKGLMRLKNLVRGAGTGLYLVRVGYSLLIGLALLGVHILFPQAALVMWIAVATAVVFGIAKAYIRYHTLQQYNRDSLQATEFAMRSYCLEEQNKLLMQQEQFLNDRIQQLEQKNSELSPLVKNKSIQAEFDEVKIFVKTKFDEATTSISDSIYTFFKPFKEAISSLSNDIQKRFAKPGKDIGVNVTSEMVTGDKELLLSAGNSLNSSYENNKKV